jgi:hypothetical protein
VHDQLQWWPMMVRNIVSNLYHNKWATVDVL